MNKKKKAPKQGGPSAEDYRFRDGPRKGTFMRLGVPPWKRLRLPSPDGGMCCYEFDPSDGTYFHVGDQSSSEE